jgi:hypothetical protein
MAPPPTAAEERPLRSPSSSALIATSQANRGGSNDNNDLTDGRALEDFARWFADWWQRRGRDLVDAARDDA